MPLLLALFAVALAAALGFAAGRMTAPAVAPSPAPPPARGTSADDVLADALAAIEGPAYALVVRIDAVATWRRTHGMRALDRFVRRLGRAVQETLPRAVDVRTGDAEVTAVCGGDPAEAAAVLGRLKAQTFRLPDGSETLVTCSLGAAAGESGVGLEDLRRRATSAVQSAQAAGRWRAFLADEAGNRPLADSPV